MNTLFDRLGVESNVKRECLSRGQLPHSVQTEEETRSYNDWSVDREGDREKAVIGDM